MNFSLIKSHFLAAAVAGLTLAATALATAIGWRDVPSPFVCLDVAAVYFVAALPLAASLATGAFFQLTRRTSTLAVLAIEITVLIFIPRLYVHARCQRDLNEAVLLSRDSRYGEARALVHRVLALEPNAQWNGTSAALAARNIDEIVERLERRVTPRLSDKPTSDECFERAELLAILGRTADALAVLDAHALSDLPQTHNLRGLIHETRSDWQLARDSYARGKLLWQSQPESSARLSAIQEATRGIAFSERKLGHLHEAEAAWQELLTLAPTPQAHLLLARFYEDTQQTAKAQFHAQQSLRLAGGDKLVQNQARALQNKLLTSHFGCVGVLSEQWTRSPIPLQLRERSQSGEGLTK